MNAYTDEKFNKEVDIKTGYKTNTILTVPIKDDSVIDDGKRIIGIEKIFCLSHSSPQEFVKQLIRKDQMQPSVKMMKVY